MTALSGGATAASHPCLTPVASALRSDGARAPLALRRALAVLQGEGPLSGERRVVDGPDTVIRYSVDRSSFDRVDPTDDDGNGRPDAVDAVIAGIADARALLRGRLELAPVLPLEIVLGRLGHGFEGVTIPAGSGEGRLLVFLESSPRGGVTAVRRAAAHQAAHAAAGSLGPAFPTAWAEALATWVDLVTDPGDERALGFVARRFERLTAGLASDDNDLAAGNAAWLAFLDEAYGPTAVRLALDELARGVALPTATDRALQRAVGVRFAEAFRDFHLWSILVGDRADGRHFPFAARLPVPSYSAAAAALPALSIQADPAVAPLGAAHVLLRTDDRRGGLTVRFEGDFSGHWDVDLLLAGADGSRHRLAIPIAADGRGDVTVPLDDVREAVLMARNLDPDAAARRYTWSAFRVPEFPVEFASVSAGVRRDPSPSVVVAWETVSESGVLGYNVWRLPAEGGTPHRVNPVWVPAVGDRSTPALYEYVDAESDPSRAASYWIESVTPEGLTSRSEIVAVAPDAP